MYTQLHRSLKILAVIASILLLVSSCKKPDVISGNNQPVSNLTNTYSSKVLSDWINFDLRLLRANPTQLNNFVMMQHWAYSSIALYEAVVPGMTGYTTLAGQLNEMPVMPAIEQGKDYHQPTSANTVLAAMIRNFYPDLPAADKISTDSLENALNARYQTEVNAEIYQRSVDYGKAVAQRVYEWSKTDGSLTVQPVYVIPVGPGLWEKTPSGFLNPQNPYWSTNRQLVAGSLTASQIPPPPVYSEDPSSDFYIMAKEVYDLSKTLTDDQKAQAIFWRDVPGGGHAHWLAIFVQLLNKEGNRTMLDKAALVYAKMGISQSDARISCWESKYKYNQLRPITYIRSVIPGAEKWNAHITTPNHPEYPAAHSTFSAAGADVLTAEFGDNYSFTDNTYDFIGLPARNYNSFNDATTDAGDSRVYAGLHYRPSVAAGKIKGSAVVKYMNEKIKFKK